MTDRKIVKFIDIQTLDQELEKEISQIHFRRMELLEELDNLNQETENKENILEEAVDLLGKTTRFYLLKARLNEIEITLKELFQLSEHLLGLCYIPNILKEDIFQVSNK